MPLSGKEMVKLFEKAGWKTIRQKGSHLTMRNPDGAAWTIPLHRELDKGMEYACLKKLKEFR
jgi:mRNA interferase HicA